jgi:hypothetical protein
MEIKLIKQNTNRRRIIEEFIMFSVNFFNDECFNCKYIDSHYNRCKMCNLSVCDTCPNFANPYCKHKTFLICYFYLFFFPIMIIKSYSYSLWVFIHIIFYINYFEYYYVNGNHELYYSIKLYLCYRKNDGIFPFYLVYFLAVFYFNKLYMLLFMTSIGQIILMISLRLYFFLIPEVFLLYVEYLSHQINKEKYLFQFVYGIIKLFLYNNYFLSLIAKKKSF